MLCVSEDEYSDSEHVHIGKYAAPRPHIQADLYKVGREIQRILIEEPGYTLNLCKLREKYEFFYGKPLDKLGYSKLVDCVYALPEPITTRNVRPNGVALLLMRPRRDSCKPFQRGQCSKRPDECDCEHECDLCGYPTHGASQCVDEGAPDIKPVQSYTHCCLRSKCVGDIHNPDVFVPDADDVILADLSINTNRISVEEMLKMKDMYRTPPAFNNPALECVAGQPNLRPAPRRPQHAPPLDERQLKIRAFYAHFIAWLKNRYQDYQDWPQDRADFSFEWESYLSGNREMRQTVVALIDFSPSAALVYLSTETRVVAIVNLTELVWNRNAVAELLEITGAAPPPSRRWSQSSHQWGDSSQPAMRARSQVPRTWTDKVPNSAIPEAPANQPQPVVEQKVMFKISLKNDDIQDPPASSKVWRPESPERYTSKIPIPTSSRYADEESDEDNQQSRAWSTSWRPKPSDYVNSNSNGTTSSSKYGHADRDYVDAERDLECANDEEEEEGAIIEEEEGAIVEDEGYADEIDDVAADSNIEGAVADNYFDDEVEQREAFGMSNEINADDAVVDSSYDIQHEYYDEVAECTHQPASFDMVSHMDSIANAYASDSSSDDEEVAQQEPLPSAIAQSNSFNGGEASDEDSLPPAMKSPDRSGLRGEQPLHLDLSDGQQSDREPLPSTRMASSPIRSSPAKSLHQEPSHWSEQRSPSTGMNSSFSALFGDSAPTQQLLPDQPFVADFGPVEQPGQRCDPVQNAENIPPPDSSVANGPSPCAPKSPVVRARALSAEADVFKPPKSQSIPVESKPILSPAAPEFTPPESNQPSVSPFAPEFSTPASASESGENTDAADAQPTITIDNKIVVGDGIGQNYRRMNDIVRTSDFGFRSDVSQTKVVADLKRLGLASGSAPNMTWNADRVDELESVSKKRPSDFDPSSQQIVSDQNEEFLKNLLYQAILGTQPTSNEEVDLFIHECLRLQHAGVESVLGGMRSLWVASRNSSSASCLFQSPVSRPVIANEAYSSKPSGEPEPEPSKRTSRLAPAPSNLRRFLQEACLEKWESVFEDQEIGFELLPELTDADLVDLGMTSNLERQCFHKAIRLMNY